MRFYYAISCLLLLATTRATAQQDYNVNLISKDLMPYASAVVRNQQTDVEVKDLDNTIYHVKKAITVLNKNGDDLARIVIWYNKSNQLRYVKGVTYDEFGKPVGKFTEKQFSDVDASNDFSMFEDSRVKHFIPSIGSYPYTIEYEYELRSKQSLNFRDWRPVEDAGVAVEKSKYTYACNPSFNISYKEMNLPVKAVIGSNAAGQKTYTWELNNLKAVRDEPYSPNDEDYLSMVKIAPQSFKYEGIAGKFTNWNELGQWIYSRLLVNRQDLPPSTAERVKEITAGITDPKEKARKIYEFMQRKTRYISVQVGIGGYQPFLASEVDRLSYGDCKALVNYTQSLFKVAGIDSWYCVVEAGTRKVSMLPDFASMDQGNHVILCLPFKGDTTFLECTSQKMPFGFLSDFTDDRTVLACTPEGGKLMHTPKYNSQANLQHRKADFKIDDNGTLTGNITTLYRGTQYDNIEHMIGEPESEQRKMLQKEYTAIGNLEIQKFGIKQQKDIQPLTTEDVSLNARDYATGDNGKLYFAINPVNRMGRPPRDLRTRTTPLYINRGYTDEDEITYVIPAGFKPDLEPLNVNLDKPFGKFSAKMILNGDKITFKRKIEVIDGMYDKALYSDLVSFYQQVVEADNYNVTLIKK